MGPIGCPGESIRNYQSPLCNIPEERIPRLAECYWALMNANYHLLAPVVRDALGLLTAIVETAVSSGTLRPLSVQRPDKRHLWASFFFKITTYFDYIWYSETYSKVVSQIKFFFVFA